MNLAASEEIVTIGGPAGSTDPLTLTAMSPTPVGGETIDFYSLSRDELATLIADRFGEPAYRATQVFEWVYRRGVTDFSLMSNIRADFRAKLAPLFHFPTAPVLDRQISTDGTRKYLLGIERGNAVEAVMIKQPNRMTLCVSSQVGCGMGCTFCRTGTMGFRRHLSSGEIIREVRAVMDDAVNFDDMFHNIVFMGMGEPLHNFAGIASAIRVLTDQKGLCIAPRKITVSTVGLVPAIEEFANAGLGVNLAVSLNATTDEVRSEIMPINRRFPIARLVEALKKIPLRPRQQITIEYVMLQGINDSDADLARLPEIIRPLKTKINLIPYNENAGLGFKQPSRQTIDRWYRTLTGRGLNTTIRWSKGADIKAACGQLAVSKELSAKPERRSAAAVGPGTAVVS